MLHSPTSIMDSSSHFGSFGMDNLFGKAPTAPSTLSSSSCAMQERLVVPQHPFGSVSSTVDAGSSFSFGWSDFPVVYQHSDDVTDHHSAHQEKQSQHASPVELSPSPSQEDFVSQDQEYDLRSSSASTTSRRQARRSYHKQVSWGCSLEIRTHSVILGDHPCCRDALPLQLGWEYDEPELVDMDTYELHKQRSSSYPNISYRSISRNRKQPPRLTYMERKNLLKRVGGMTEDDLARASGFKHVQRSAGQLCTMDA